MSALPAIRTAVLMADEGLDFRPYLRATDETERMVEVEVARQVVARRAQRERDG